MTLRARLRLWLVQFWALYRKNWIILSRHWFLNLVRCFILPIAYGIFLGVAQLFLLKPNNLGLGTPTSIYSLNEAFPTDGSLKLLHATAKNISSGMPSLVIQRITRSFSKEQLQFVQQIDDPDDVPRNCQQNFNGFSECYAALIFNSVDDNGVLNYTIRADAGLFFVDVLGHQSDFEKRVFPLQWAVDRAIIFQTTGVEPATPEEWPFTNESNEEQSLKTRLSFNTGIQSLLVLTLFIAFLGIPYHLPGTYTGERSSGMAALMGAMGCGNTIRLLAAHLSISTAYFPAWIIVGAIFHIRIFTSSSLGLIIGVHILLGLSLASFSVFVSLPFSRSAALSAVWSTFLTILLAILALVFSSHPSCTTATACIYLLFFPPGYYIFVVRAIAGWEKHLNGARIGITEVSQKDPQSGLIIGALIAVSVVVIILYPALTIFLERKFHEPSSSVVIKSPSSRSDSGGAPLSAISIRELGKVFVTRSWRGKKSSVTGIHKLTLDIPTGGIFVLLGSNGAGKSTLLSLLAGYFRASTGSITFYRDVNIPLGIVPQKNILLDELTCKQTVELFIDLKSLQKISRRERSNNVRQLLNDVGLWSKRSSQANELSGGMKRKLQLAIGMAGNPEFLLVDECTSGVDPLSRRALWRTLTAIRDRCTIIFTTHFLDEADLVADSVAILRTPGELCAHGTPVTLKNRMASGFLVRVTFPEDPLHEQEKKVNTLLRSLHAVCPDASMKSASSILYGRALFELNTSSLVQTEEALRLLEREKSTQLITDYSVHNGSLEDVFQSLMIQGKSSDKSLHMQIAGSHHKPVFKAQKELILENGSKRSPFSQAITIFLKRCLIFRRNWISLSLGVLVAICGSCIPLFFLTDQVASCEVDFNVATNIPLFLPLSPLYGTFFGTLGVNGHILESPPGIISQLGPITDSLHFTDADSRSAFTSAIEDGYRNLTLGGVVIPASSKSDSALLAWEASSPGFAGATLLNLVSNILWNENSNGSVGSTVGTRIISANYQAFPVVDGSSLFALKWVGFFGASMGVFPAFFALYISQERRSAVQAMQFSNGLSNSLGLWLGHLLFDSMFCIFTATVIIIIFATTSNQFHGLGYFWLVLLLYGLAGALFAYLGAIITSSALAAFALAAGYQVIMFILYLAGYLLTLTYAKTSRANDIITIIHYTISLVSPVASVLRACLVSVNLFSLLCSDNGFDPSRLGRIEKYGGPIVYLLGYLAVLLFTVTLVDSGSQKFWKWSRLETLDEKSAGPSEDLRVLHISKRFGRSHADALHDVSFKVSSGDIFALLGPNGAGKTSLFNIIRGGLNPDKGDVLIHGSSILRHPESARLHLGVCPQFTAIDSQLTVQEHLYIYGRLKGVRESRLTEDIVTLMDATDLSAYSDRLASQLSGGNQRKLSLAISLIGNPSVVLIDEFSSGIDPKTKRDMWSTFLNVSSNKAMVLTTHSMEEAAVLSTRVGILANRMLASGSTEDLIAEHATYEVHFSIRTSEESKRIRELMSTIPGSRMADDVATRYEVPISSDVNLPALFHFLRVGGDSLEYAVERASLESIFLKVIRQHQVEELEMPQERHRFNWTRKHNSV